MTKGWVQSLQTGKQYLVSKWNEMKMHFEDNFFVCNIQIISNTNEIYCKGLFIRCLQFMNRDVYCPMVTPSYEKKLFLYDKIIIKERSPIS